MIEGNNSVVNALLGTLLTWGLTAAGASLVFFLPKGEHKKLLDGSLGFAAGVMIAASFWSLLAPSIEKAEQLGYEQKWLPAAVGFLLGGIAIALTEQLLPEDSGDIMKQLGGMKPKVEYGLNQKDDKGLRRILLLVLAITIHNFPEGLAVGVGFGAVETGDMSIGEARALAWGIGLQNFPEGLAVSLPLYRQGMSVFQSFWLGQLSGMVEPIAGVLGALLIHWANPVLPYALSFAAGAMIYVVVDDLIPEVVSSGNTLWSTWGCMIGFLVMMIMDVALG
jgi:ZIP family zinc transporter